MQPPSGSVPTLPMPPFLTSVSPTSTVHGIKANWADFFWFIFWLQASLHQQLLNVLISLFKLSQAVQAKQKNACLLAGFCQVFASPVYYIVRWSKSMQYEGIIFWEILTFSWSGVHSKVAIACVLMPNSLNCGRNHMKKVTVFTTYHNTWM